MPARWTSPAGPHPCLVLAPSVGAMKLLQLLLVSFLGGDLYHPSMLARGTRVFGVLLSPPSGMSWVVSVDASPRAVGPTGAKELAAGLWVTPWTVALGPGCLLLPQGL